MRLLVTALLAGICASAGPIVSVTSNASTLANTLLGPGITLSGTPSLTETGAQAGTFTGGPTLIGFASGIILSSGDASSASGSYSGQNLPSTNLGGSGDSGLSGLIGGAPTYDASVLQFNFIPNASTVTFQYTFASAEYPQFVGSQYNDVFAFFVNGTNYALIPNTTTPVSINTINALTNSTYFKKYNTTGDPLPYGGETTVLTFTAPVNTGVVNSIELGIADVSDGRLDSTVFIKAGSFTTNQLSTVPEPASLSLIGAGLGLMLLRRSKARRQNRVSGAGRTIRPR